MKLWKIFGIMEIVVLIDFIQTYYALKIIGGLKETNPIGIYLLSNFGFLGLFLFDILVVLLLGFGVHKFANWERGKGKKSFVEVYVLIGFCLAKLFAIINNFYWILK